MGERVGSISWRPSAADVLGWRLFVSLPGTSSTAHIVAKTQGLETHHFTPCGWELFVPPEQVVERLGADRCTVCANYDREGR